MISRPSRALVNLTHLRENYRTLRALSGPAFFCPMVKAEAYGHGAVPVARALSDEGCPNIGVAILEEALQLRRSGIHRPDILVFGAFGPSDVEIFHTENLIPVVSRWEDLQLLGRTLGSSSLAVHVKFNTGMNRLGFEPSEAERVKRFIESNTHLRLAGVCTHFLNGGDAGRSEGFTLRQVEVFKQIVEVLKAPVAHALNSSSMIGFWAHGRLNELNLGVRPGIALYGLLPEVECSTEAARSMVKRLNLRPVLSVESQISRYHEVELGGTVSYGARWKATRRTRVAVVPLGYGDGYPRVLSNRSQVLVRGRRCAVLGTVTMDYIMVDVTEVADLSGPGERVLILGADGPEYLGAKELADLAGTIDYEIVTRLGARLPRVYSSG